MQKTMKQKKTQPDSIATEHSKTKRKSKGITLGQNYWNKIKHTLCQGYWKISTTLDRRNKTKQNHNLSQA